MNGTAMLVVGVDPGVQYGLAFVRYFEGMGAPVTAVVDAISHKAEFSMLEEPENLGSLIATAALEFYKDAPGKRTFSVERAVHGPSMAVFAAQNRMLGVLVYRLRAYGFEVWEPQPTQSKKALVGKGNAAKDEMVEKASEMFLLAGNKKEREAKADAIGHALALLKFLHPVESIRYPATGRSGRSARDAG